MHCLKKNKTASIHLNFKPFKRLPLPCCISLVELNILVVNHHGVHFPVIANLLNGHIYLFDRAIYIYIYKTKLNTN